MKSEAKKKTNGASRAEQPADARTQIEKRAYELWLADSCREGNDLNHWLQAEREMAVLHSRPGVSSTGILS
jgi:hypothetical protein